MSKFIEVTCAKDGDVYIIDIEGCIIYPEEEGCRILNAQGSDSVKESYEDLIKILNVKRTSYKY